MGHQEDIDYLWKHRNDEPSDTTRVQTVNSVSFCLPSMPISVNQLYEVWWQTREVKKTRDYRTWATEAKGHMPPFKLRSKTSLICVNAMFFYNFYRSNGGFRKFDTHNLMKALIDTIASRYGFDDERVKRCPIDSRHSKDEQAIVTVSEYTMEENDNDV